ncbi:hypothetical protein ACFSTD_10935 [Novosphingobium colocasiae]
MKRHRPFLALAVMMAGLMPAWVVAAPKEFDGQGFDCYFQTGLQKLDRVSVWYGGLKYANDKTPQFADPARLIVRQGVVNGAKMTFYVSDKWPDTFDFSVFRDVEHVAALRVNYSWHGQAGRRAAG